MTATEMAQGSATHSAPSPVKHSASPKCGRRAAASRTTLAIRLSGWARAKKVMLNVRSKLLAQAIVVDRGYPKVKWQQLPEGKGMLVLQVLEGNLKARSLFDLQKDLANLPASPPAWLKEGWIAGAGLVLAPPVRSLSGWTPVYLLVPFYQLAQLTLDDVQLDIGLPRFFDVLRSVTEPWSHSRKDTEVLPLGQAPLLAWQSVIASMGRQARRDRDAEGQGDAGH